MLNNRPHTSISDDITDLDPLTSNHFLIGRGNPNFRINTSNEANINLQSTFVPKVSTSRNFYVPEAMGTGIFTFINTTTKMDNVVSNFKRGDLVLISRKDVPRSNRPLARVLDIYRGEDALFRS